MKCLLIGGGGFIGYNLALNMLENGNDVTVYDRIDNPFIWDAGQKICYVKGDYFNAPIDDELIACQNNIVLLTCSVSPQSSMEKAGECYGQDMGRLVYLLDLMRKNGAKRLILISSGGTVYGNHSEELLMEEMPAYPINHYGILKLAQEKILLMYNQLYGMKNVVLRLSNPYGCGQRVSSGIGAVTAFMEKIANEREIIVYGQGNTIRDYIYIDDLTEMICRFMQKDTDETVPIYNIGTGIGTSIQELIAHIEKIVEKKAKVKYETDREFDVKRNVLCTEKIRKIIGDYQCLPIEYGIKKYYEKITV